MEDSDKAPSTMGKLKAMFRRKETQIVVSMLVIVVIAFAASAFWDWHKQPEFCSQMCHKTMSHYYETWSGGPALARVHSAQAGHVCMDCHESSVGEQVGEMVKYVSGDYETPLSATYIGTNTFCLRCHGSYEALAKKTAGYAGGTRNPHRPHGYQECYDCHSVHGQSVLSCVECHPDMPVPEGWR